MTNFWNRFLRNVVIGAVAGLLVGLLLVAVDAIENPFWAMSAGIFLAAVFTSVDTARRDDAAGGSGGR
jgi:hypothetical protein